MADVSRAWREPSGAPLEEVAPTTVNLLLECPRRVAYQRDEETRGLSRPSTRSALGRVAHELTEKVLKGHAPAASARRSWLESEWVTAVAQQADLLAAAWPDREVPPPERWPGYVATRTRLLRRLCQSQAISTWIQPVEGGSRPASSALPWIERKLVDEQSQLSGRPDLVEERAGRLRVVDLKSGVQQAEMREPQRRQLLLYAHLVRQSLGRLVDEIVVVDVKGAERVEAIQPTKVVEAVATATAALREYNEAVDDGAASGRPSDQVCRFCPFKVVCEPYWSARRHDWEAGAVAGTVSAVTPPNIATVTDGDESVRVVLPETLSVKVGDEVAMTGLASAGRDVYRLRWDSHVRIA